MARPSSVTLALASVDLFAGLNQRQLGRIAGCAKEMTYSAGTEMVVEGGADGRFFLIMEGDARVIRKGRTVARLTPGSFFGEVAVIDNEPRSATVVADTPVRALTIARWHFRSLLLEHPQMAYKVMLELCRRWREKDASPTA